jgi:lipoprotein-releasing system permease protein
MFRPYEVFVGLRYVRARRRNHFISFVSFSSILGVTLGVTALITVLSVMNGFEREVQERTLEMISHATLMKRNNDLSDWEDVAHRLETHPGVVAVAPFTQMEGILTRSDRMNGVLIRGIVPELEGKVSELDGRMQSGRIAELTPGAFRMIIGIDLAGKLDVNIGDRLVLLSGRISERRQFTVTGIFKTGMQEFDNNLAVINMQDAMQITRQPGPDGLSIRTVDAMRAPVISREASYLLDGGYGIVDWTQRNRNFFYALKTQKLVMFVILALIIGVAAFNIVSTLVMVVIDKQADIAILKTQGATSRSIMKIFMTQGVIIGLVGMLLGNIFGIWLARHIDGIVRAVENTLHVKVLPCDVYMICDFPTELHWGDVALVSLVAFVLSVVATLYPAWRAAGTRPAETLRYE